jgi:hypothetical protein
MAFVGQRFSQFGGQHAATPKGWITNNPDIHATKIQISALVRLP